MGNLRLTKWNSVLNIDGVLSQLRGKTILEIATRSVNRRHVVLDFEMRQNEIGRKGQQFSYFTSCLKNVHLNFRPSKIVDS